MIAIVKIIFRLYILQTFAFLAVWFSTYYPGLDILLALAYLIIVGTEASRVKEKPRLAVFLLALIWQGPAALLSFLAGMDYYINILSENAIFLLEFWSTPLLPLLTILTKFNFFSKPMYYYIMLATPWLLGFYYYDIGINCGAVSRHRCNEAGD